MEDRTLRLLLGVVGEYIKSGEPVGSAALARTLRLDVSPATVRSELHELEEAGYIYQPHTSAGRVPTDKGYRFFVDHVRTRALALAERERIKRRFAELAHAHDRLTHITAQFLAQLARSVAVSSQSAPRDVHEAGLRDLVRQSDEETLTELHELSAILDRLDQKLGTGTTGHKESQVYIGEEIPFMPAQYTSLVMRDVKTADGRTLTLVIIGPKRMPYQRNVALLNTVADVIEQQDF